MATLKDIAICSVTFFNCYMEHFSPLERTGRFFRHWREASKKFINSPIGQNTFPTYPKKVAEFLGLSDPETYTGHCWRATSATVLADNGASQITLKRAGNWKSDTVAEGYIRNSKIQKTTTASILSGQSIGTTDIIQQSKISEATIVYQNCVFTGCSFISQDVPRIE
jgi:hypothetical protein